MCRCSHEPDTRWVIRYAPGVDPCEFFDTGMRVVTANWMPTGLALIMPVAAMEEANRLGYSLTPRDL
jgi:hypothetical protein